MRRYKRHQVNMGLTDLLGNGTWMVNVVGDPDWVKQAIDQAWFSISKTRGIWRVFLPYTEFFDVIGSTREPAAVATEHYIASVRSVLAQLGIHYRDQAGLGDIGLFRVKFQTRQQVNQFVLLMQMNGCKYIETARIMHGPR